MQRHWIIEEGFSSQAAKLRAAFDTRFRNPKETRSDRFVWDFWNVPGQYTHLRTPAEHFFPRATYQAFLRELGAWGAANLGCHSITPPWLSYYVEGCEQKLHSDVPHGPWAFVFSLSPKKLRFHGGETQILRPETLSYWRKFSSARDREHDSFVQRIAPRYNRLIVFDPRLPHGVSRVSGTMDPREARLVLHGWFADPKPVLEGPLSARQVAPILDEAVEQVQALLAEQGEWHGILSLRLSVGASGRVAQCQLLASTLVNLQGDSSAPLEKKVGRILAGLHFPKAKGATGITLPLLFR